MNAVMRAAENWYGYGAWDAPYWFVGPEPGMAKSEGDNLLARSSAWDRLWKGHPQELVDCLAHHQQFRHLKFLNDQSL